MCEVLVFVYINSVIQFFSVPAFSSTSSTIRPLPSRKSADLYLNRVQLKVNAPGPIHHIRPRMGGILVEDDDEPLEAPANNTST